MHTYQMINHSYSKPNIGAFTCALLWRHGAIPLYQNHTVASTGIPLLALSLGPANLLLQLIICGV